MKTSDLPQKLRVLIAANGQKDVSYAQALVLRLSKHPRIETRVILDEVTSRITHTCTAYQNKSLQHSSADGHVASLEQSQIEWFQKQAYELCEWADMLVLAPIDANTFAKMLQGITDDLLLEVLRSWDVSKKILLVPGMSTAMWENPMTKKHLNKVRRKWNWVRVLQPILWHFEEKGPAKCFLGWDGFGELVEAVKNQADLMTIGHDVEVASHGASHVGGRRTDVKLPPEIWGIVLEYVADWEMAMALGVYTNLSMPSEWQPRTITHDEVSTYMRSLEWTILTSKSPAIIRKLDNAPKNIRWLSSLCVKLIIKFSLTDILTHLETHFKDVFWASFGPKLLPTKASAVFGRIDVLEWWRTSPSFLAKEYTAEALDGASKSGFVHVLDWWRSSGLPLRYTEAALEQASAKGHIAVLEWWKDASLHHGAYSIDSTDLTAVTRPRPPPPTSSSSSSSALSQHTLAAETRDDASAPLRLKVGKSILAAAQHNQPLIIRWWDTSSIPYSHEETVARIASAHGHVAVLDAWKELKGEKMIYDNQVLIGATKNGHADVLEWWRSWARESGMRVEYKTCDVEEALEDSVDVQGESRVRVWWARNGLNLGVGTSEWMKVKVL